MTTIAAPSEARSLRPKMWSIVPANSLAAMTRASVIVISGPRGAEQAKTPPTLDYARAASAGELAAVCTSAMIIATAGILDGRVATTKAEVVPRKSLRSRPCAPHTRASITAKLHRPIAAPS